MSKPEWNPQVYAKLRPTYDPALYDRILKFHKPASLGLAVELGCGTGLATQHLAPMFERLIAMDPSVEMLKQAKETVKNLNTSSGKPVEFRTGGAQDLDFNLDASSVDLICAGTAAHWFPDTWWEGAYHVLKPNGTVSLFAYCDYGIATKDGGAPEGVQEVNAAAESLLRDEALGPKEGNKITSSQYDLLHLPEGSGWTQPERHKWTYHKTESEISQDEFWSLLMTASHIREWASKEADPESETTPLGQAKQRIVKNWPQGKSTCLALPMVAVMLRKLV